jgi:hypothetical protein
MAFPMTTDSRVAPGSHGSVGQAETTFVRLLPPHGGFEDDRLVELAEKMIGNAGDQANNDPDGEENLLVPAGYTYLGQFIDHDLTFDTTSSLDKPGSIPTNLRTPRLDLDCLYGSGPSDEPYLYAPRDENNLKKGISLAPGRPLQGSPGRFDLPRIAEPAPNGFEIRDDARAIIGDPRNDENAIVCNLQAAFIQFHNSVVYWLDQRQSLSSGDHFSKARNLVRWTYQKIVVRDYLRRIIQPRTYNDFREELRVKGENAFRLYPKYLRDSSTRIPLEFAGAAYRFGHSMIRTGYKLNPGHEPQKIFTPDKGINSLVGFGKLRDDHWIQWKRFFPEGDQFPAGTREPRINDNTADDRLQWAYRIDTSLVDPLRVLPEVVSAGDSLAVLNLRRGNLFRLASGQTFATALGLPVLEEKYLVVRDNTTGEYGYEAIHERFKHDTPLWFYILAEAQKPLVDAWLTKNGGVPGDQKLDNQDLLGFSSGQSPTSQLGPVGGRIVLETFYGLLFSDPNSYGSIHDQADRELWQEWLQYFLDHGRRTMSMWTLLEVAGLAD